MEISETVTCGNIPWHTGDEVLACHMAQAGRLVSCQIQRHADTLRSKGWAIIRYLTPEEGANAVRALHRTVLDGRTLNVRFYKPSKTNPQLPANSSLNGPFGNSYGGTPDGGPPQGGPNPSLPLGNDSSSNNNNNHHHPHHVVGGAGPPPGAMSQQHEMMNHSHNHHLPHRHSYHHPHPPPPSRGVSGNPVGMMGYPDPHHHHHHMSPFQRGGVMRN